MFVENLDRSTVVVSHKHCDSAPKWSKAPLQRDFGFYWNLCQFSRRSGKSFVVHDVGNSEGWPEDLCKQLYYGQAPPFVSTNMGS